MKKIVQNAMLIIHKSRNYHPEKNPSKENTVDDKMKNTPVRFIQFLFI